jgi:5-methyltetrahydrofolate--homocysteine methyltransferase
MMKLNRNFFKEKLKEKILVFDGAMGTMLQKAGLKTGECPELYNLNKKNIIYKIHRQYIEAGCDVIQTNTFGGNPIKLSQYGLKKEMSEINKNAVWIAKEAAGDKCFVAGDIGPSGKLMIPIGSISFQETYKAYYQQAKALIEAGVDFINIETMSDIQEAKAAVIAAKDAGNVPIICSMTYEKSLRTLTGSDPESVAVTLEAAGADVIGVNCGFGPELMVEILKRMYEISDRFFIAQPNAGLPKFINGESVYDLSPKEMADYVEKLVDAGANLIGGCCGTTPEHIKQICKVAQAKNPKLRKDIRFSKLASGTKTVIIDAKLPTRTIGECINPTAKKYLANAVIEGDFGKIGEEAQNQVGSGANIIDVNMGVKAHRDSEKEFMEKAIIAVQQAVQAPLSIDTVSLDAMRAGLEVYRGKPLLNSTNGEETFLDEVIRIAKRYGAAILGLTLDERGIPDCAKERFKIAEKIVSRAIGAGIRKEDIFIDGLVLTAGAEQERVLETLKTIRLVKENLGVKTILGVSNISHGLPCRSELNSIFLAMALEAGLDLPIINPYHESTWTAIRSADVLTGRDCNSKMYVKWSQDKGKEEDFLQNSFEKNPEKTKNLADLIKNGNKNRIPEKIEEVKKKGITSIQIIDEYVIPALEEVGELYEKHIFFLPQLLIAAETAQSVFEHLKEDLRKSNHKEIGTIVLATVKGDIHDIGKNIVGVMLQNQGFKVIDLGKNVSEDVIIETAIKKRVDIIGLSALMTTTMQEMQKVVEKLKALKQEIPVMVGGAVITADYAKSIGAYYAEDAVEAVKVAKKILSNTQ